MSKKNISFSFDHAIKLALKSSDKEELRNVLKLSGYIFPPDEGVSLEQFISKTIEDAPEIDARFLAFSMTLERFIRENDFDTVAVQLYFHGHEVLDAPLYKVVEASKATHFPVKGPPSIN